MRAITLPLGFVAALVAGSPSPACRRVTPSSSTTTSPDAGCGPLDCRVYESAATAVQRAIEGQPLIIGFGEAHAPKDSAGVESSAARFADTLLPILRGRASDLILELMLPPQGCPKPVESAKARQQPVIEQHADTDQGEYVRIGDAARKVGIVPDLLRPSCEDLDTISRAGEDAVPASLDLIRRLTVKQVRALLRRADRDPEHAIVVYGGALHNDPAPPPARAGWSYARELSDAVGGRYVAIDLFVPQYVQDDDSWRAFDWFPYYDRAARSTKATMFHPRPDLYVVLFPWQ